MATTSPFAAFRDQAWPIRFTTTLQTHHLVGGIPNNPKVAEGWLRSKLQDNDDRIRQLVLTAMLDRGLTEEAAVEAVTTEQNVNGFRADDTGLFIEGRQVKAAIKEAANVAVASGKIDGKSWGQTNKGLMGFIAEHVIVPADRIHLHDATGQPLTEPTGIHQRFVHTFRGSSITLEEYVDTAYLTFDVLTDWDPPAGSNKRRFDAEFWAQVWLTGEQQGIGASRSQGFGRYTVTQWDRA